MDPLRAQLVEKAAAIASDLSSGQAEALALELESVSSPSRLRRVGGLPAPRAVKELCDLWQRVEGIDGPRLADAIRCAARAIETVTGYEKVELLYTGPGDDSLRRTRQGLLEVVRVARSRDGQRGRGPSRRLEVAPGDVGDCGLVAGHHVTESVPFAD